MPSLLRSRSVCWAVQKPKSSSVEADKELHWYVHCGLQDDKGEHKMLELAAIIYALNTLFKVAVFSQFLEYGMGTTLRVCVLFLMLYLRARTLSESQQKSCRHPLGSTRACVATFQWISAHVADAQQRPTRQVAWVNSVFTVAGVRIASQASVFPLLSTSDIVR